MKVIDLLNKMADGEDVPKQIIYEGQKLYFDNDFKDYFDEAYMTSLFRELISVVPLNYDIEIIEEDILTKKEKEYLNAVIKPFREEINYIQMGVDFCDDDYVYLSMSLPDGDQCSLPNFQKGTMYRGMELNKEYTLEELGL